MREQLLGCKCAGIAIAQLIFVRKQHHIKPDVLLRADLIETVDICHCRLIPHIIPVVELPVKLVVIFRAVKEKSFQP